MNIVRFFWIGVCLAATISQADDLRCQIAKENADYVCAHNTTVDAKTRCYKRAAEELRKYCLDSNPLTQDVMDAELKLNDAIQEKYRGESGPDKQALAETKKYLNTLNSIVSQRQAEFNAQAQILTTFARDVTDNYSPSFAVFNQQLQSRIVNSREANSSTGLAGVINEIRVLTSNESHTTQDKIVELGLIRLAISRVEERLLASMSAVGFRDDVHWQEALANIRLHSETLESIDRYLHDRHEKVAAKTQQLADMLDQKLITLLNQETQTDVGEALQNSVFLARSGDFLTEVNDLVETFKTRERSPFNRIPYQSPYLVNAGALKNLIHFCESSSIEYWQSLGCNRAVSFKSSVDRAASSSVPGAIQFGLRTLASLGGETPQPDMQAYIAELVAAGRVVEAAAHFDRLLDEAGGEG